MLAVACARAGRPVTAVSSRTLESAVRLADRLPNCIPVERPTDLASHADVIFLTVPDDQISAADTALPWTAAHLAVHCSGARPASVLTNARAAGAHAAGFHPLQTFAELDQGLANLPGSAVGIEADGRAWTWLSNLGRELGLIPLAIPADARALYHAASVLASNYTVGLIALAANLWQGFGISRSDALRALLPLLAGTVRNLDALGVPAALTGPVVRGDVGTVKQHAVALQSIPVAAAVYESLGGVLIELALERGTISADQAEALRAALASSSSHAG